MRIVKRFLKWFAWLSGALVLLVVLFLTIPGVECSWRYPAEGTPWIMLHRQKGGGEAGSFGLPPLDVRHVHLGGVGARLILVDSAGPAISAAPGVHWERDLFWYSGERWVFSAGTRAGF